MARLPCCWTLLLLEGGMFVGVSQQVGGCISIYMVHFASATRGGGGGGGASTGGLEGQKEALLQMPVPKEGLQTEPRDFAGGSLQFGWQPCGCLPGDAFDSPGS